MDPVSLDDQAILVRASHQMRAFEDRFLTIGLPYRVIGGPRFYERLEIRDAMAYFRLAVSTDDDLAGWATRRSKRSRCRRGKTA